MKSLDQISKQLMNELFNGAQIISSHSGESKGYVLLKRQTALKEEADERLFLYAMYEYNYITDIKKYYLATQYVKGLSKSKVIKEAKKSFFNH